ncbi:MAG: YkgJ family cysteine cluster protein [Candidatus Kariarchaeum pelagius]|jgi:Fe-S-cluster containining protein
MLLNTCKKCILDDGGCCTSVHITIHKKEAKEFIKIKNNNQIPSGHSFQIDEDDPNLYTYKSGDDPCMFLDKNQLCEIYENRPTICRTFPLMWIENKQKLKYYVDTNCPLYDTNTPSELMKNITNLPYPNLMKKIGELDFDISDNDYIELSLI